MNFGLTIIAISYIIYLIVPGLFFKKFFFQSKFETDFYKGAFADRLVTSIFWGSIIQIFSTLFFISIIDYNFDEFYTRINNIYRSLHENQLPIISSKQLRYILIFFAISISFSCFIGSTLHNLIRIFKLDIRFSPLRFSNEWNYIFRNELDNSKFTNEDYRKTYLSTEVDIYMNDFKEDRPSFYTGILKDYYLTAEGHLDRISLSNAKKRDRNRDNPLELIEIVGDTFIIPYCNIANMNLRYNYQIKQKGKVVVSKAIQNTIMLFMVVLLMLFWISPWFTDVSIWSKIIGMILFSVSWIMLISLLTDLFSENKKLNLLAYLILLTISMVCFYIALSTLNIFHIIDYISNLYNNFI